MNKIIILAITIFSLTACGNNTSSTPCTHTHEDGTVHHDHEHESACETTTPTQESFQVEETDTTGSTAPSECHTEGHHHHDHSHHQH